MFVSMCVYMYVCMCVSVLCVCVLCSYMRVACTRGCVRYTDIFPYNTFSYIYMYLLLLKASYIQDLTIGVTDASNIEIPPVTFGTLNVTTFGVTGPDTGTSVTVVCPAGVIGRYLVVQRPGNSSSFLELCEIMANGGML